MKTIFDYNPTEEELKRFGGIDSLQWAIERGLYENEDNINYHLGLLFAGRGDKVKANAYFSKVKNKDMLRTLMQDF